VSGSVIGLIVALLRFRITTIFRSRRLHGFVISLRWRTIRSRRTIPVTASTTAF